MKYCKKCLQPDTRPNEKFINGVCSICRYYDSVEDIDWNSRYEQLQDYLRNRKKKSVKNSFQKFDCIIGVSGGKDSTRQALWVRDKLKLNLLQGCLILQSKFVILEQKYLKFTNFGFDFVVSVHHQKLGDLIKESF